MTVKTSLNFPIGIELEYFPIELEVNENDVQEPVVFAPFFPLAEDYDAPAEQIALAWQRFGESIGIEEQKTTYKNKILMLGDSSSINFINLENDDNKEVEIHSDTLKTLRYGMATFRVYGPEKSFFWEDKDSDCSKAKIVEVDLYAQEKLMLLAELSEPLVILDELYYDVKLKMQDSGGIDKDLFDSMRVSQNARCSFCEFNITINFLNRFYQRKFIIPSNRGKFLLAEKDNPVKKVGRKEEVRRELLVYSGDIKKQIKYWYIDETKRKKIKILNWSKFKDITGKDLKDPNKQKTGNTLPTNFNDKNEDNEWWETTFYAPLPCWGSILVEYPVDYTEFQILYDIPGAKQEFEVSAGSIEKIGFNTFTKSGDLIEYSAYLNIYLEESDDWGKNASRTVLLGMEKEDIEQLLKDGKLKFEGFDDFRVVNKKKAVEESAVLAMTELKDDPIIYFLRDQDLDTGIEITAKHTVTFKKFDEFYYEELYAVRLFNKLKNRPFKVTPFKVLITNGRRMIDYSFSPPPPVFLTEKELPRGCIFEERVIERIFPFPSNFDQYIDIEHIQQMDFVDTLGNTSSESLTKFNKENEQRVADIETMLQAQGDIYDKENAEMLKKEQVVRERYQQMMVKG